MHSRCDESYAQCYFPSRHLTAFFIFIAVVVVHLSVSDDLASSWLLIYLSIHIEMNSSRPVRIPECDQIYSCTNIKTPTLFQVP